MIVNTNIKERIKTAGLLVMQSYKILMGTMISVFVPQKCYFNGTDVEELCTITGNLNNEDHTHRNTLYFNCFTAVCFLGLYYIEMKRETWLIKHLDIDHSLPDNNLKNVLQIKETTGTRNSGTKKSETGGLTTLPAINETEIVLEDHMTNISTKLVKYNSYYYYASLSTFLVFFINNMYSINILNNNSYGSATLNTYISFLMLILVKLYNSLSVSYRSKRDIRAFSAYMVEFSSFNKLDERYNETNDNDNKPEENI